MITPKILFTEQWKQFQHVLSKRQQNLSNLAEKNPTIYRKNMLVIDHQVPQSKTPDSKELEPAAHHLYRIIEVQPKNL